MPEIETSDKRRVSLITIYGFQFTLAIPNFKMMQIGNFTITTDKTLMFNLILCLTITYRLLLIIVIIVDTITTKQLCYDHNMVYIELLAIDIFETYYQEQL